jgi:FKBP-type peptidyl-prolyl cis-trans isomerase SlpA
MTEQTIKSDSRVTLHFSLKLEDGTVVDSNFEKAPATFTMGDGSLLAGFEGKLNGMTAGQQGSFDVLPEESFGQPNPNNIQEFPRKQFADDMELAEGLVISFADVSKAELPGVVKTISPDTVTVDFNHPLAGRIIHFEVQIIEVSQTPEVSA